MSIKTWCNLWIRQRFFYLDDIVCTLETGYDIRRPVIRIIRL